MRSVCWGMGYQPGEFIQRDGCLCLFIIKALCEMSTKAKIPSFFVPLGSFVMARCFLSWSAT